MLCSFQVHSKVIQSCMDMYLLFFRFFSYLGYYRMLRSRSSLAACFTQSYTVCYTHTRIVRVCTCPSQTPNLPLRPHISPLVMYVYFLSLCDRFCSVSKFISIILLDSTYKWHQPYLSLSVWLHLVWQSMLLQMELFHSLE